jgi:hypothetical protein
MTAGRSPALALALALAGALACSPDPIDVSPARGVEHNHAALNGAVARYTASDHSPEAFARFAREVLALRPGMDSTVADLAELQTVSLMLDAATRVPGAATGAPAAIRTIWPLALAPAITAPIPGLPPADAWTPWIPRDDDTDATYLQRLCDVLLARPCHHVVPESMPAVVAAVAIREATGRMRRAVAACPTCKEAIWAQRVAGWTELDRAATANVGNARSAGDPARWPMAGVGAVTLPAGPLLDVGADGLATLDGEDVPPPALVNRLASVRRGTRARTLLVHLPPSAASEQVRTLLARAAAAGFTELALVARETSYPWRARGYRIPVTAGLPVRDADTVQVLVRFLDRTK